MSANIYMHQTSPQTLIDLQIPNSQELERQTANKLEDRQSLNILDNDLLNQVHINLDVSDEDQLIYTKKGKLNDQNDDYDDIDKFLLENQTYEFGDRQELVQRIKDDILLAQQVYGFSNNQSNDGSNDGPIDAEDDNEQQQLGDGEDAEDEGSQGNYQEESEPTDVCDEFYQNQDGLDLGDPQLNNDESQLNNGSEILGEGEEQEQEEEEQYKQHEQFDMNEDDIGEHHSAKFEFDSVRVHSANESFLSVNSEFAIAGGERYSPIKIPVLKSCNLISRVLGLANEDAAPALTEVVEEDTIQSVENYQKEFVSSAMTNTKLQQDNSSGNEVEVVAKNGETDLTPHIKQQRQEFLINNNDEPISVNLNNSFIRPPPTEMTVMVEAEAGIWVDQTSPARVVKNGQNQYRSMIAGNTGASDKKKENFRKKTSVDSFYRPQTSTLDCELQKYLEKHGVNHNPSNSLFDMERLSRCSVRTQGFVNSSADLYGVASKSVSKQQTPQGKKKNKKK